MKDEKIQWQPWGEEAFLKAKTEGKPIFLSISASWCHWCHVMDGEGFAHPEVIRRINAGFVPVRVDSDKRPDINSRYNMGGWPTVVILDPEGNPVAGDTYLPTGPLLMMLSAVDREPRQTHLPRARPGLPPEATVLGALLVDDVVGFLDRAFDREFGGFGGPPKFPQPWGIELALQLHQKSGDKKLLRMALLTLDNIREGEIHDRVDEGFFRYATRGDWDRPHYEKLLETNTRLLSVYLDAYRLTRNTFYRTTAEGILDYLHSTLAAGEGTWFWGSQSADRDYYSLPEDERLIAEPPPLDKTIYADRNAMAASALLAADALLEDSDHEFAGLQRIEFLWERFFQADVGMFHYDDGTLTLPGFLSDQVYMAEALIDGFEASGDLSYLERAERLAGLIGKKLGDPAQGGFWDLPEGSGSEGALKVRSKPFIENAAAAMVFTRLAYLTTNPGYRGQAESALAHLSTVFRLYKQDSAPFGLALERFISPPHEVIIIGEREDPGWKALLKAARRIRALWKVVLPFDSERDRERIVERGYPIPDRPTALICVGKTCLAQVYRPDELDERVTFPQAKAV